MTEYKIPVITEPEPVKDKEIILVASGDLRQPGNKVTWPAQEKMEKKIMDAFAKEGYTVRRGHQYDPVLEHGFIHSQRMGMDVFGSINKDAPLIIAEAVWQYSHHLIAGLLDHRGPILIIANWSGEWPGLVGTLNLMASLRKAGIKFSAIWSQDFTDDFFLNGIREWLKTGNIKHDTSHVSDLDLSKMPKDEVELGKALAKQLKHDKAIFGVFDEGCMGMYNAIINDEMLMPMGVFKERLSQSALLYEMSLVTDDEAQKIREWLNNRGVTFVTGSDPDKFITDEQILEQCKMYIAAVRMADEFGCDAIGIQYQQGLKDMAPATDLVEGMLNNPDRPPVFHAQTGEELYKGKAVPHFNEVDEGAGIDIFVNNRVWTAMDMDPSTTLHDLRYGEYFKGDDVDDFVWVFMISGAAPASHFVDGYKGASSERQPVEFFPKGGGTMKGIAKPGELVWSRIFIEDGILQADLGRAKAITLPREEVERRWSMTNPQWPIMNGVLYGVTRDQMMARHRANHIIVVYADNAEMADKALAAKASMLNAMGIKVHLCGI